MTDLGVTATFEKVVIDRQIVPLQQPPPYSQQFAFDRWSVLADGRSDIIFGLPCRRSENVRQYPALDLARFALGQLFHHEDAAWNLVGS